MPTPAGPKSVTSCGVRSRTTRDGDGGQDRELLVAADQRRVEPGHAARRGLGRDGLRAPRRDRPRSFLSRRSPLALRTRRPALVARLGSLADEHLARARRACCRRAATLTASPLTISSPRAAASRPETTSPVLTPMRSPTSAPWRSATARRSASKRVADRERCADGALGVVLVRLGDPEHREHRVADELLASRRRTARPRC